MKVHYLGNDILTKYLLSLTKPTFWCMATAFSTWLRIENQQKVFQMSTGRWSNRCFNIMVCNSFFCMVPISLFSCARLPSQGIQRWLHGLCTEPTRVERNPWRHRCIPRDGSLGHENNEIGITQKNELLTMILKQRFDHLPELIWKTFCWFSILN